MGLHLPCLSQEHVHVLTKKISKTFTYKNGEVLDLEAYKANVNISTWDRNEVQVNLNLVAKNLLKNIAEKELSYHKEFMYKKGTSIVLKNTIIIPEGTESVSSFLTASYDIKLPSKADIILNSKYGISSVKNTNGTLFITSEYGQVILRSNRGFVRIYTMFSDIDARSISSRLTVNAEHAKISLNIIGGEVTVNNKFGVIELAKLNGLERLDIEASKCEVHLMLKDFKAYNYNLSNAGSNIVFNTAYFIENSEPIPDQKFKRIFDSQNPAINIKTSMKQIIIQDEKYTVY